MAIRKERVQLEVEINGKKAGTTLSDLNKTARNLKRELNLLTPGSDKFIKKSAELKKVNDRLAQVRAQTRGVATGLNQMNTSGRKLPGVFTNISSALNKAGILALIALIVNGIRRVVQFSKESLNFFDTQAKADAQLKASIISTNGAAGRSFEALKKQASELQGQTLFGDETIQGAQAILLTFTNVRKEIFDRATPAILDMSTALKTDLKSASLQVGKALNDPIKGVSALSRAGVQFTKDQEAMIKSLVKGGQTAKAQEIILAELETQFSGSAEAAAKAGKGGYTQLVNRFNDIREKIGLLISNGLEALQPAFIKGLEYAEIFIDGLFKIPAVFTAIRAGFNQFITNIKTNFADAALQIERFKKRAELTITFDSTAAEDLRREIADIDNQINVARSAGKSIGEAVAEAYNKAINKVDDFSAESQNSNTSNNTSSTTNTTTNTQTTAQLFKIDLAAVRAEYDKLNVLLETERLNGIRDEESYLAELEFLKRDRLEAQLEVYKKFGKDQETEAIKINNKLLALDFVGFDDRKKELEGALALETEILRGQLASNDIVQEEFDQQTQLARSSHLESLLDLLKQYGQDASIEAEKIRTELASIATNPITFQVELNEGPSSSDIGDIDSFLEADFTEGAEGRIDQLDTLLRRGIVSEIAYQKEVLKLEGIFLQDQLQQLKDAGDEESELRNEIDTRILENKKARHNKDLEEQKAFNARLRKDIQDSLTVSGSLFSALSDQYAQSIEARKRLINELVKGEGAQTDAVKKRIKAEEKALKEEEKKKKKIEIANVLVNLASEISNIFKNFSSIPIVGQILAGVQAGIAVVRANTNIQRIQAAAEGGQVLSRQKSNGNPFGVPVYSRPASSIPKLSGEAISVPANISGVETGDNVLMLGKRGEVVLNDSQQAQLASLTGMSSKDVFKTIGVRGFMEGGPITDVNTTPTINDFSPGNQESDNTINSQILEQLIALNNKEQIKTVRAVVVYSDIEEAEEEINTIRNQANLGA